jgi:hypothetical protein
MVCDKMGGPAYLLPLGTVGCPSESSTPHASLILAAARRKGSKKLHSQSDRVWDWSWLASGLLKQSISR